MAALPISLQKISLFLERLPGIGEKTANRLAMYLLRLPENDLKEFAEHISELKKRTKLCKRCMNLTEDDICSICTDEKRDRKTITVVETVLDLLSFETGNIYNGTYYVLHGKIDPLNNIGPDDLYIPSLFTRLEKEGRDVGEIILATNPDMEGEATAVYLMTKLKELQAERNFSYRITRLAYGLPIGANLEYADYGTLGKSLENRRDF